MSLTRKWIREKNKPRTGPPGFEGQAGECRCQSGIAGRDAEIWKPMVSDILKISDILEERRGGGDH